MNLEKEIFEISLVDIMPNRFQPREIFDDEALIELSESIKAHGVIQPIIVRKVGDKYEIIAGERRYRASQLAGKQTIPALVRDIDDKEAAKIALLENLQRRDLTPIEEAKTYQTILKLDNITQDELARNLGKSQSAVANKLRLLTLNEDVQTALLNSQISERHARSLLPLNIQDQKILLDKIIKERLTVRQVDEEVMKLTGKIESVSEDDDDIKEISRPEESQNMGTEINNALNNTIKGFDLSQIEPKNTNIEPQIPTEEIKKEEQLGIFTQPETNEPPKPEQNASNIFDSLRIDAKPQDQTANYNDIYDIRFAINNFRQAVQNTEKFGFKVNVDEKDNGDTYQITINIDKKNDN